ncbi:MAG: alpha/beta hydrolase [Archangiaceae bacterium]|nr:alpha/beta hydrolase [Archangiaceae bacterium]
MVQRRRPSNLAAWWLADRTRHNADVPKKPTLPRSVAADLRAASRLLVDATTETTTVVEQMHHAIASGPFAWPARKLSGLVYSSIRGVTRAVGLTIDKALEQLAPALGVRSPGPEALAALAALNGVIGDVLAESGSPLAQPMELHRRRELPAPSRKVLVLVHGSSMNDLQWKRRGHDHGAALERDLGWSAFYVRYNSGLHVSVNGRELSALLEQLVASSQVEELAILGFSMGGLVARSACHVAELEGARWRAKLTTLICMGTPHHGSPVERAGSFFETALGVSRYSAPLARLGKLRSAGVTDLRFGFVSDTDWKGRDRFDFDGDRRAPVPLPRGVRCYALAGTQSKKPGARLRSDGLVPVASGLGHAPGKLELGFPEEHQQLVYGATHLDLLHRPEAYAALRAWLSGSR